jgi:hypothetical protein
MEPGHDHDWTFGGMLHDEAPKEWLDRVHPESYIADGQSFRRCPTCEEWSPCTVRERLTPLIPA